jgi:hypothetical protein
MAIEGPGGADNTQSETTNEAGATAESVPEQTNTDDATERADPQNAETPRDGANRTRSVVIGGTTFGAASVGIETARRLGTDRHAEAGFAERAHAEAYAKKVGGTVVDDGSSVFTPDGGIDGIVKTASGQKHVQSKHYGQAVGNSTLKQYAGDIDIIGATNGVTESADTQAYNIDVITAEEWSWRMKAELQGRRIIHGCHKGIAALMDRTRAITSRLVNGTKFVGRRAIASGKWLFCRLVKVGSTIAAWVARRSLVTQLVLIVAVVGLLYLLWLWYTSEDEETMSANTSKDQPATES